jgi:large subunit ribosomal protein L30
MTEKHVKTGKAGNKVKVTLIKSMYGQLASIRNSARGLGLRRIGHSVVVADTPSNRGMMNAASHMLKIEPALGSGKHS